MGTFSPEHERAAIRALFGCVLLAGFGAAAAIVLVGWLMSKIAEWVFS